MYENVFNAAVYVSTSENVADIFTKALAREAFIKFCGLWVVPKSVIKLNE